MTIMSIDQTADMENCLVAPENVDMCMSYGWGSTGENVTSERYTT